MKLESVKIQRKRGKCNHAIIIIWTLKRSGLLPLFFPFFKCCCCSLFVWLFIFKCFAQINEINNDEKKDYKIEIKKTHMERDRNREDKNTEDKMLLCTPLHSALEPEGSTFSFCFNHFSFAVVVFSHLNSMLVFFSMP